MCCHDTDDFPHCDCIKRFVYPQISDAHVQNGIQTRQSTPKNTTQTCPQICPIFSPPLQWRKKYVRLLDAANIMFKRRLPFASLPTSHCGAGCGCIGVRLENGIHQRLAPFQSSNKCILCTTLLSEETIMLLLL